MKNKFKLIIFDWDGTLLDSHSSVVKCYQAATEDVFKKRPESETILRVIGLKFEDATKTLFSNISDDEITLLKAKFEFFRENDINKSSLFSETTETIKHIHNNGYILAISTNREKATLARDLRLTGLKSFFKICKCANRRYSKPHPIMLLEIIKKAGVERDETLFIGDSKYDVETAHNASVKLLLINDVKCYKLHYNMSPWVVGFLPKISKMPNWLNNEHSI